MAQLRDRLAEPLDRASGDLLGALLLGVDRHDRELVAAVAGHEIVGADGLAQREPDAAEDLVAGQMALALVDLLEVVQVHEDDGQRATGPPAALHLAPERLVECRVVHAPRERIGPGRLREVGVHARVAAGDGRKLREAAQQLRVLVEHHAIVREAGPKDAAQLAVPAHRDRHGAGDFGERGMSRRSRVARVVVRDDRASELERARRDPPAVLDGAGGLRDRARRLGCERLARAAAEDEHAVGAENAGGLLADPREDACEVEALIQGLRRARDRRLPGHLGPVLGGQLELRQAGAGGLRHRGHGVELVLVEGPRFHRGDQEDVGERAAGMRHGGHDCGLRPRLETAGQRQLARLRRAEAHRCARRERLGQRRRFVESEPLAARRHRIAGDDRGSARSLLDHEHQRGRGVEVRARLAHEDASERLGTRVGRRAREQARHGTGGLAAASPVRLLSRVARP